MFEPLGRAGQVGAVDRRRQRLLDRAEREVATHSGSEVEDHVDVAVADDLDHLGVQARLAGARAR